MYDPPRDDAAETITTDAARAAADLVLAKPGLNVITQAIVEARRIFERMNAYAIYRITVDEKTVEEALKIYQP